MLKNITKGAVERVCVYSLEFTDLEGNGYSFPCDEDGKLEELSEAAQANLKRCLEHPDQFEAFNELVERRYDYVKPATGTCSCGSEVVLVDQYYGACQCTACGRWYNLFGQELRDPEHWLEDPCETDPWEG